MRIMISALAFSLSLPAMEARAEWFRTGFPIYMSATCLLEGSRGTLLAGTADNGLQRSTDAGTTWTRIRTPAGYSYPVVALARGDSGEIYLTDGQRILTSPDDGDTWTPVATPPLLASIRALAHAPGGDLYAGGRNGICVSRDKGRTWKHTGLLEESVASILILDAATVFLGCTNTNSLNGGVYRTDSVGSAWSFIGAGKSSVAAMAVEGLSIFAAITNGGSSGVIGADRQDYGTWYAYSKGLPEGAVAALATAPDGALWAAPSKGGAFRSSDGAKQWSPAGLDSLKIRAFMRHSSGILYAGTEGAGVFKLAGAVRIGSPSRPRVDFRKAGLPAFDPAGRISPRSPFPRRGLPVYRR